MFGRAKWKPKATRIESIGKGTKQEILQEVGYLVQDRNPTRQLNARQDQGKVQRNVPEKGETEKDAEKTSGSTVTKHLLA